MPHQETDERAGAHAAGLRRVAVASVAALAVVLPFAAATAGTGHHPEQRRNAGHSATHHTNAEGGGTGGE